MGRSLSFAILFVCVSYARGDICTENPYCFQAESGPLSGRIGVSVSSSVPGYSGTGYVTGFDSQTNSDRFTMPVTIPAGLYELWVGYRSQYGQKGYTYTVGSTTGEGFFDQSSTFSRDRAGLFNLSGGQVTVGIRENWGFYDVDYLDFRPFTPPALLPVSAQLSDPQADANTQHLMNYLTSTYGEKTLSGQQGEVGESDPFPTQDYLNKSVGVVPAVRGSDLIFYSPSFLANQDRRNGETDRIINWARQTGGVATMMWHWNAPANLVNSSEYPWWRGFYTQGTTFGFDAQGNDILLPQLVSQSGPQYDLILRDIDAIAVELQAFEDAGVPVIWRPLHEAQGNANGTSGSGAWFWWGAHGPEVFKELWQLMHDRLTNHHGLHNLLWEFTSSAAKTGHQQWYPGDDVVDMVGLDIYTEPSSTMSGEWYDILATYNGRKMISLSETDTLPDPDLLDLYGIHWGYISPWNWGYVREQYIEGGYSPAEVDAVLQQKLQELLNSGDIVTEKELPLLPWSALDFDRDGEIGAADYVVWRKMNGLNGAKLPADGDLSGQVNAADYTLWWKNFGRAAFNEAGAGVSGAPGVPEPGVVLILLVNLVYCAAASRRRARCSAMKDLPCGTRVIWGRS